MRTVMDVMTGKVTVLDDYPPSFSAPDPIPVDTHAELSKEIERLKTLLVSKGVLTPAEREGPKNVKLA